MNGALLVHKAEGISSFGVIKALQDSWVQKSGIKRKSLPKMGHGGTLDPFATGLLIVLVGKAVKLARYFLGSPKVYSGSMFFGERTSSGDLTNPVIETSPIIPSSIETLQALAADWTQKPYFQTPPMFSAKKLDGKPLYELARKGIEVERESKYCTLYSFEILNYTPPLAEFEVACSSGTYVRTLAEDFAKELHTLSHLKSLCRISSGVFNLSQAWKSEPILETSQAWDTLPCWVPFDELLKGYSKVEATPAERQDLFHGKQEVLLALLPRIELAASSISLGQNENCMTIYCESSLIGIARRNENVWNIERVFC